MRGFVAEELWVSFLFFVLKMLRVGVHCARSDSQEGCLLPIGLDYEYVYMTYEEVAYRLSY